MTHRKRRGNIILEFSLVVPFFLLPMFLFTYAIGINLLNELEVIQFSRDAGHMYVVLHNQQKTDISSTSFQNLLAATGGSAGFPSSTGLILAQLIYVDGPTCVLGGGTSTGGGCANYGTWVYGQYFTYGTPPGTFHSFLGAAPSGGTGSNGCGTTSGCNASDDQGDFSSGDIATKAGLQVKTSIASAMGILPWNPVGGSTPETLPSQQTIYYVEVGGTAFNVPGVTSIPALTDHAVF
jgi:hypothetical protein